jgi:hypothetical protein
VVGIVLAPADVDPHIAAVGPAQLLQALLLLTLGDVGLVV